MPRPRILGLLVALSLVAAAPIATADARHAGPKKAHPGKKRQRGHAYGHRHARGQARRAKRRKCLRAGQRCRSRSNRYYRRFGYRCKRNRYLVSRR